MGYPIQSQRLLNGTQHSSDLAAGFCLDTVGTLGQILFLGIVYPSL